MNGPSEERTGEEPSTARMPPDRREPGAPEKSLSCHRTTGSGKDSPIKTGPARKYLGLTARWWLAAGLILAFVGVNLQLLTHIVAVRWFGIGLIIIGMAKAVYWVRVLESSAVKRKTTRRRDLADGFIYYITIKGRLRPWIPVIGIIVILIDLGWNLAYAHSTDFQSQDWTMWALGAVLLIYPFIPVSYARERDFAFIMIFFYSATMVLPMGLYRLATHTVNLPEGFVYAMLATPTSWLVNLTGASSYAHGSWITFTMTNGHMESLGISTACAGLDSLFLFISGFIAFLLVENQRFNRRIAGALVIGIFTAYFANLLRMTIIVLAGVNYGRDVMLAVHENAGTLIFLGWIAIFWYLMYVFVIRRGSRAAGSGSGSASAVAGGQAGEDGPLRCADCGTEIDPENVPEKCPKCGREFGEGLFCESCGVEVDPRQIPEKCPSCGNPFGK